MPKTARLLYANNSDWRYATGHAVSDPVLWYQNPNGQTFIATPELEMGMFQQHIPHATLVPFGTLRENAKHAFGAASLTNIARVLVGENPPETITVPSDFPLALADALRSAGLNLITPEKGTPFFAARMIKTEAEVAKLQAAQSLNEQTLHHAVSLLKAAKIEADSTLSLHGKPLTAEFIRAEMRKMAMDLGAEEFHGGPIVACGAQGALPHERGHGVLRAHELIVIDTFPRHANGYWGDLTRTFVKGKPTDWQHKLYSTVLNAQTTALASIKAGANGTAIHQAVDDYFTAQGYPQGTDANGLPHGYIHSLGHAIGVELHDVGPGLSSVPHTLQTGSILTVEPGLYYPTNINGGPSNNIGGVRIEDVVVVTETGHRNLTTFPKDTWIID